jgi:hypothetical protein
MSNLVGQETLDDRRMEYLLLKRLNEKLIAASKLIGGSDPQSDAVILDAVQHNCEVWNAFALDVWPAAGFTDTELGVLMEPEVGHGTKEVHTGVQA